tara:strand:- start:619 stop:957 length:339 start_codon:yes stop_codon:yes gene_type:complete
MSDNLLIYSAPVVLGNSETMRGIKHNQGAEDFQNELYKGGIIAGKLEGSCKNGHLRKDNTGRDGTVQYCIPCKKATLKLKARKARDNYRKKTQDFKDKRNKEAVQRYKESKK